MKKLYLFIMFAVLASLGLANAATVTDVLTAKLFTATENSYTDFSNVTATSSAVYAGNSAKSKTGAIQLRSKNNNSGIVTTASAGTVRKNHCSLGRRYSQWAHHRCVWQIDSLLF